MVTPRDTTPDAFERRLNSLRRMGAKERLRLSLEMSDELREVAKAGIRARHPGYGSQEVDDELEALMLGRDLAAAARRARLTLAR